MQIFHIPIDGIDEPNVCKRMEEFLVEEGSHQIATLNPEMLLAAKGDQELTKALQEVDMRVADGFGIRLIGWIFGKNIPRITGVEVVDILIDLAQKNGKRIMFFGAEGDRAKRAAELVKQKFPDLTIESECGGEIKKDTEGKWLMNQEVLDHVRQFAPDILCVSLSVGKQEKWIHDYLKHFPSVKIAVGVGGVFAFLCGDISRAPLWIRKIGCEWLWRLIQEPTRIGRIIRAIIVFPVTAIWDKVAPK